MAAPDVRIAVIPRASQSLDARSHRRRRTDRPLSGQRGATDDLNEARGMLVALLIGLAFFVGVVYVVRLIVR